MSKSGLFWVADYAAGIAAALAVLLLLLLIWAWVNLFDSHVFLGVAATLVAALVLVVLVRAIPYVRKRADEVREQAPEESLSGLLRELKEARTEREEREKREKFRGRRR